MKEVIRKNFKIGVKVCSVSLFLLLCNCGGAGLISLNSLLTLPPVKPSISHLAVADRDNNRILIWNSIPTSNQAPADVVLGQPDFISGTANNGGISATSLSGPRMAVSDGKSLIVSDTINNRILIWKTIPTSNLQPADIVLGQPDFVSSTPNNGGISASTLNSPQRLCFDGTHLLVADQYNNRVLIWNSLPTSHFQAANLVLGQPDFVTSTANTGGVSASTLVGPYSVQTDRKKLIIQDTGNHRSLIWNTFPTQNGQAADLVLGQPSFSSNTLNNGGISPTTLNNPTGLSFASSVNSKVIAADQNNSRVLIWNTFPTQNQAPADVVLGQPDFVSSSTNNGGISAKTLNGPNGLFTDGTKLFVSDLFNGRILIWNSIPTSNQTPADVVLGQPDFVSSTPNNGGISAKTFSLAPGVFAF